LRSVLLYYNKKGKDFDCSKVESKVAQLVKSLLVEHFVTEALKSFATFLAACYPGAPSGKNNQSIQSGCDGMKGALVLMDACYRSHCTTAPAY